MATIEISEDELLRCKRSVIVLAEISKVALELTSIGKPPLELREDLQTLMRVLRRLEAIASK